MTLTPRWSFALNHHCSLNNRVNFIYLHLPTYVHFVFVLFSKNMTDTVTYYIRFKINLIYTHLSPSHLLLSSLLFSTPLYRRGSVDISPLHLYVLVFSKTVVMVKAHTGARRMFLYHVSLQFHFTETKSLTPASHDNAPVHKAGSMKICCIKFGAEEIEW